MSFFTSLTGLNAATTQLSVTSNNIANAGTTGFKRSRSDFGDIFATSPLQKASTVVGQGTALKQVTQEFSQGNIELSGNSLDLAVTGEGFFPIKSSDGQNLFTRNGSFLLDEQNTVVNSAGQFLRVANVDSLGKADFQADLIPLSIAPNTVGLAIATSEIGLAINFPAESLPATQLNDANIETIKPFNPDDSTTYAKSAAVTIFDENGNDFLLTFYYRRVQVASAADPFNKWQTHIVLDGQEIEPGLGQATSADGTPLFVDKYGTIIPENELPVINGRQISQKYILDDLASATVSTPAKASGEKLGAAYLDGNAGVNFAAIAPEINLAINDDELAEIGTHSVVMPVAGNSRFAIADDGLKTGDRVVYNAGSGDVATGLIDGATYFVVRADSEGDDVVNDLDGISDTDGVFDDSIKLAATYAGAIAADPVTITFFGGTNTQTLDYEEVVTITLTDEDGAEESVSSIREASTSIDILQVNDIEADDRVSLLLTDEDGVETVITTAALGADTSVTDIITGLNRAAEASTTIIASILNNEIRSNAHGFRTGDKVQFNAHGDAAHGTGLIEGQTFFAIEGADANTFSLAETYAAAIAGTPIIALNDSAAPVGLTIDSDAGLGKYTFSALTDINGEIPLESRIVISRADGKNFSIAEGTDHSLSGESVVHENVSAISEQLGSTTTELTQNGTTLGANPSVATLSSVLAAGGVGSNYSVSVSTEASNTIVLSRADGANFKLAATRIPNDTSGLLNVAGVDLTEGVETTETTTGERASDLSAAFDLTIDEDPNEPLETESITIDLSSLAVPENDSMHGSDIAELMTKEINRQLGDQKYFDLSSDADRQFRMTFKQDSSTDDPAQVIDVFVPKNSFYTESSLSTEIQRQLREATGTNISVSYNRSSKGFVFLPDRDVSRMTITNVPETASLTGSAVPNVLFGLNNLSADYTLDSRGRYPSEVIPNGTEILDEAQQRFGIQVEFDSDDTGGRFTIASGKTGDSSAIRIDNISEAAATLFGFNPTGDESANLEVVAVDQPIAERGVESTPAVVYGRQVGINPDETFFVDEFTNEFTVTVDNVTETFKLPVGTYSLPRFREALENRINAMEDARGTSISGIKVTFDQVNEIFTFTTGTTGNSAFLQISGPARYGLEGIDSNAGQTVTYRSPVVDRAENGDPILVAKIDGVYQEFTESGTTLPSLPDEYPDFEQDPAYRPLFLDKGELTFDTAGNLISPIDGIALNNVVIGGSGNTLNIDIGYQGSTQFSGDFSVNSQGQNGQPNGSLVSVDIADDGLVTASYSNGTQDLKGKIVLATFSTPNGLRQLGDSTFLESNESGSPTLGEPGGAGFGTIRAGARERANVDLTSELVDLITAQRNFQANAKAIETSSTLTSTIINIRS
jgi:flagellar hook-basal body protein